MQSSGEIDFSDQLPTTNLGKLKKYFWKKSQKIKYIYPPARNSSKSYWQDDVDAIQYYEQYYQELKQQNNVLFKW